MKDTDTPQKVAAVQNFATIHAEIETIAGGVCSMVAVTETGDKRFTEWGGTFAFVVRYAETGNLLIVTREGRIEADLRALVKEMQTANFEPLTIKSRAGEKWREAKTFRFKNSETDLQLLAYVDD